MKYIGVGATKVVLCTGQKIEIYSMSVVKTQLLRVRPDSESNIFLVWTALKKSTKRCLPSLLKNSIYFL